MDNISSDNQESTKKEYEERFSWRISRQIYNPNELKEFAQSGGIQAHALLEHSDPDLSIIAGKDIIVEKLPSGDTLIELYRGDTKKVIECTFRILQALYGD